MEVFIVSALVFGIALTIAFGLKVLFRNQPTPDAQWQGAIQRISLILTLGVVLLALESFKTAPKEVMARTIDFGCDFTIYVADEDEVLPEPAKPREVVTPPPPKPAPPIIEESPLDIKNEPEMTTTEEVQLPTQQALTANAPTIKEKPMPPIVQPPSPPAPPNVPDEIFIDPEKQPEYPGGLVALRKEVARKFRIPRSRKQLDGKVVLKFEVTKTGAVGQVEVLKEIEGCTSCIEEAKKVIKNLKHNFTPGEQAGAPVRVWYILPIQVKMR